MLVASLLLLTAFPAASPSQSPHEAELADLTVRLVDLVPNGGPVVVAIFATAASFESRTDPLRSHTLREVESVAEWRVEDLPPGEYAVVVFQDVNTNGRLDRGKLGLPKEPFGFSNGVRGRGPPTFEQTRFEHQGIATIVEVQVVHRSKR